MSERSSLGGLCCLCFAVTLALARGLAHLCEGGGCRLLGPYGPELWAALGKCISPVCSPPGLTGSYWCSVWPQALGHCPTGCLGARQTPLGCRCRRLAAASALGLRGTARPCLSLQSSVLVLQTTSLLSLLQPWAPSSHSAS